MVVGHFLAYSHIGHYLGVLIDDNGVITFQGKKQNPSYVLDTDPDPFRKEFTKADAIKDWCRCYMEKNLSSDYRIYRYLT